jgi:outer membrane lipoprotein-sorting protein
MKKFFLTLLTSLFFINAFYAIEIDTIIDKLDANTQYDTAVAKSTMITKNTLGTTTSSFTSWNRKNGDTLIEINSGVDKGQKILRQGSSIFLFYPDAEEVIRLSGSAMKDSLMGTDFSYEDLTGENTIKARFNCELLGTEVINNTECYHIILTAKSRNETYQKQESWVDSKIFVGIKTILYSASGKALREMYASDIRPISGYNVAFKIQMQDLLKKNSKTEMIIEELKLNTPIENKLFTRENLTW